MIIVKALTDIDKDIKSGDYLIANEGAFFFALNNHQVEMYRRGKFAYDLVDKKYIKINKDEADKLIKSADNPIDAIKDLETKVKELEEQNKQLQSDVDKVVDKTAETTDTKSKK